ncbi:MAG: DUF2306 domain-containing protein [Bdellovibrionaceae bacterium]|nr:DUF2306 domain-containing protein [Pseudobdellovibrionaceae bacterium]
MSTKIILSRHRLAFAGLITLGLIPVLAGGYRFAMLIEGSGAAENARFLRSPIPILIHLISMLIIVPGGAYQLTQEVRLEQRNRHRYLGFSMIVALYGVATSGLWMTHFYERVGFDGPFTTVFRWAAGLGTLACLFLGVRQLFLAQYKSHGHWMMRSYALAMGAGTQVFTHIPFVIWPNWQGQLGRALAMGAGWIINLIFVESIIRRSQH